MIGLKDGKAIDMMVAVSQRHIYIMTVKVKRDLMDIKLVITV